MVRCSHTADIGWPQTHAANVAWAHSKLGNPLDTSKSVAVPVRRKKAAAGSASPRPKVTAKSFPQDALVGGSVTFGEKRVARPIKAAPVHRYKAGDRVRVNGHRSMLQRAEGAYRVLATLPFEGNALQYRVRNDEERYERIVSEDDLEMYHSES
jgi:hypothetical protein